MNVNPVVEPAYNATVIISQNHLRANKFPHAAFPVARKIALFRVVGGHTQAIAKILFFQLARVAQELFTTISTSGFGFMLPARSRSKSLPLPVALVIAACASGVSFGVSSLERFSAYGATERNVTALVIPVVLSAVLVKIQVSALLARELMSWNYLPTTTSAVDNFRSGIFGFSGHLSSPFAIVILRYCTIISVLTQA